MAYHKTVDVYTAVFKNDFYKVNSGLPTFCFQRKACVFSNGIKLLNNPSFWIEYPAIQNIIAKTKLPYLIHGIGENNTFFFGIRTEGSYFRILVIPVKIDLL